MITVPEFNSLSWSKWSSSYQLHWDCQIQIIDEAGSKVHILLTAHYKVWLNKSPSGQHTNFDFSSVGSVDLAVSYILLKAMNFTFEFQFIPFWRFVKKGLCPVKKEMLALLQLAKYFVATKELRYKMFLEADEADSVWKQHGVLTNWFCTWKWCSKQ